MLKRAGDPKQPLRLIGHNNVGSYWIVLSLDYRRKRKATVDALGPNMRLGKGTRRATRNDELLVTHLVGADSKTAK